MLVFLQQIVCSIFYKTKQDLCNQIYIPLGVDQDHEGVACIQAHYNGDTAQKLSILQLFAVYSQFSGSFPWTLASIPQYSFQKDFIPEQGRKFFSAYCF